MRGMVSPLLLTNQIHANPVSSVHVLLDVPDDVNVLQLADRVMGGASGESGATVRRHQVCVAGRARRSAHFL